MVVIDGCSACCSKATLEHAEVPFKSYVILTDLGIEKNKDFNMSFLNRVPERTIRLALLLQILIMGTVLAASGAASSPSKNLTVEEAYLGLATGMLKLAKLSDLGKGEILKKSRGRTLLCHSSLQ